VPSVAELAATPTLRGAPVVVDQTGVGRPVVEMLERASIAGVIVPFHDHCRHEVTKAKNGGYHVPKRELVTCLQVIMQGRKFRVAQGLPDAGVLIRELENFRVQITSEATEVFGPSREGQHDDLVISVALATWYAESVPRYRGEPILSGGGIGERVAKLQW
jgi:hypothetical protein